MVFAQNRLIDLGRLFSFRYLPVFYYIPINDTPLTVFWTSDAESHIKLTFSESVSLSLKTKLMTLLNILQKRQIVPRNFF